MSIEENNWPDTESHHIKLAFGKSVARRRKLINMSQRSFARVVGISYSHLRKIESGEVSPTLVTIWKIADVLEIPAEEMVSDTRRAMLRERMSQNKSKS